MTTYKLAAFDMAGTTVDEDGLVYRVLEETASAAVGDQIPHDLLAAWKGTSKLEALQGILGELGRDNGPAAVDALFAEFSGRLLTAYREAPPSPFPGIPETIAALRSQGVKVALQTGYSTQLAQAILDGMGWTVGSELGHTVDALVTSDMVAASRPAPYLIFRCMEATGVFDVRSVITAGDTPNDVWAGHNAGARMVVGVLTGSFDRQSLTRTPNTHILHSLADLPPLL